MAADDAVSLLRSLKAAGEKTGAVEAEGALHLRRTSRRTMDGIHDAVAVLQGGAPSVSLPSPKFPAAAGSAGPGAGTGGISTSGAISVPSLSFNAGIPNAGAAGGSPSNNQVSLALALGSMGPGSLPVITSTATSPGASPSRLSVRPPTPLTSLPSPTGGSPGGAAAVAGCGAGGPPSPPCAPQLGPGLPRRAVHAHSSNGVSFDAVQLPHSHGSPLPLLFDPPVAPSVLSSSPSGAVPAGIPGVSSPGSPSARQVQLTAAGGAAASPTSPSGPATLPSIPSLGSGSSPNGGGPLPPTAPAPMPSLLPNSFSRAVSGRNSINGAASTLVAAAAGGGGAAPAASAGGSPLSKSTGAVGAGGGASPASAAAAAAAAPGNGGSARPLRPPHGNSISFGLPAPPSLGSPSGTSSVPGSLPPAVQSPRAALSVPEPNGSAVAPLPLAPGAAQAALQLQTASSGGFGLQHQPSLRPSSARSVAGCTVPEGLTGTLSSRRLSMTGAFEASLPTAGSQKLVMAAAHELSSLTQAQHAHHPSPQQQQQQQLQQLLPAPRLSVSARGPSVTNSGAGPSSSGGGTSAVATASGGVAGAGGPALPRGAGRDSRSSDPGTSSSAGQVEFGFPTPEPPQQQQQQQQPLGRPSLAPLPNAVRASTPPSAASPGSGLGWPLAPHAPASPQLHHRAPRPEPLLQRPEPPPAPATPPATASSLPEPLQLRSEPLPPLPSTVTPLPVTGGAGTAGQLPLKPPLGRAGTLAPLGGQDGMFTIPAGAVAESTLDSSIPDLDPAALFGAGSRAGLGSGSGPRPGFMELTVRSIAAQPATPGPVTGGGGGSGGGGSAGGDKVAVQSSVRQRLQADPLRFHPPAPTAGGSVRRLPGGGPHLDPLEATPRLILGPGGGGGGGGGGGAAMPLRFPSSGRADSPKTTAAGGGGTLWAPSQDILPHMVSRASTGGGGGGGCNRLPFQPGAGSPVSLAPATPGLELPTPRLRNNSGSGWGAGGDGSFGLGSGPSSASERIQQQRPLGGMQSNYLQALAAAAGLGGGGGSGAASPGGGSRLQRQRSLSDSGCASFLAAADSGPVGLPLEGGLAVLGDMWERVRGERRHNTRYGSEDDAGAGDLSATLDDTAITQAAAQVAAGRTGAADGAYLGSPGAEARAAVTAHARAVVTPVVVQAPRDVGLMAAAAAGPAGASLAAEASGQRSVTGSSRSIGSVRSGSSRSSSPTARGNRGGAAGATHGSEGLIRLDASVSSLPLKALRAAAPAPADGAVGTAGAAR